MLGKQLSYHSINDAIPENAEKCTQKTCRILKQGLRFSLSTFLAICRIAISAGQRSLGVMALTGSLPLALIALAANLSLTVMTRAPILYLRICGNMPTKTAEEIPENNNAKCNLSTALGISAFALCSIIMFISGIFTINSAFGSGMNFFNAILQIPMAKDPNDQSETSLLLGLLCVLAQAGLYIAYNAWKIIGIAYEIFQLITKQIACDLNWNVVKHPTYWFPLACNLINAGCSAFYGTEKGIESIPSKIIPLPDAVKHYAPVVSSITSVSTGILTTAPAMYKDKAGRPQLEGKWKVYGNAVLLIGLIDGISSLMNIYNSVLSSLSKTTAIPYALTDYLTIAWTIESLKTMSAHLGSAIVAISAAKSCFSWDVFDPFYDVHKLWHLHKEASQPSPLQTANLEERPRDKKINSDFRIDINKTPLPREKSAPLIGEHKKQYEPSSRVTRTRSALSFFFKGNLLRSEGLNLASDRNPVALNGAIA